MDVLRGAVIGFGKLGLLHSALLNGLPGCELVAVVESSEAIQRVIQQHLPNVVIHEHVSSLIASRHVDLAVVATPTGSHVEVAVSLARANIPMFIEKPLALSAAQAEPLVDELAKRWVPNMVGYMGRYVDTFRRAKKLMSLSVLGPIQMVRSSMYIEQLLKPGTGWRYERRSSGGGVLITQNSHLIDKLMWLFGEISEVSGHTTKLVSSQVEDHVHAFFKFRSGAVGFLDASWSARHFRIPTITIHAQGENGTLDVTDDEVRLYLDSPADDYPAGWSQWRTPDLYEPVPLDVGGSQYSRQMLDFLEAVRSWKSCESDVTSALKTQRVIDGIYRSANQGGVNVSVA